MATNSPTQARVAHGCECTDCAVGDFDRCLCLTCVPDDIELFESLGMAHGSDTDYYTLHYFQRMLDQGHLDGPAEPTTEKCEFPHNTPNKIYAETDIFLLRPLRPEHLHCHAKGMTWSRTWLPGGIKKTSHFCCQKCDPCEQWAVRLVLSRYAQGRGPMQTLVRASGFPDVDSASKWLEKSQVRRCGGKRLRIIHRLEDYTYEGVLVYDRNIGEHLTALTLKDIDRKGLDGSVTVRPYWAGELEHLMPLSRSYTGDAGTRRETRRFADWPDFESTNDYAQSDPFITVDDFDPPPETRLTWMEKERRKFPLDERRQLWAQDWADETGDIDPGLWDALVGSVRDGEKGSVPELMAAIREQSGYGGCTAQLVEVATFMGNPALPWKEYYRPTLDVVYGRGNSPQRVPKIGTS